MPTGAEIAAAENCDEKTVTNVTSGIAAELPEFQEAAASHAADERSKIMPMAARPLCGGRTTPRRAAGPNADHEAASGVPAGGI
jgi:hypothetical protein